ncbi:hypothetical protein BGY98DRAFT_153281 [Russula aff. rugulosa BPL654]|nr:hypothetical protein BGY98DRAFT_153281 [Russula aff. rugulosa BPL654]
MVRPFSSIYTIPLRCYTVSSSTLSQPLGFLTDSLVPVVFPIYFNGIPMLEEGYKKTRPGLFKIASFRRWMVLASGSELIDDIRRAPDDVLSRTKLRDDFLQEEYTLGILNPKDHYSSDVIRSKLTRDVASTFDEVRGELTMAIDDLIPTSEHEWVKVPFLETIQRVICRTTNRIFVGVPLCRDRDYQNLNLTYSINVMKFGIIISWFPNLSSSLFHAYYRIFPPRSNKKLNSLDLWFRSDLRRWRSMGRLG